jgi:hypothetical protein
MFFVYLLFEVIIYSSFRVLGFKVLPLLINIIYFIPFSLFYVFGFLVLYSEEYFSRMVEKLSFLFILSITSSSIYFSFIFISVGSSATIVSLKFYLSCSMIIGNFIDVYLFGFLAVIMNWFCIVVAFGWLLSSFLFYLFLHRLEMFLLVLSLLESFSSLFQSLTLSNRLSINLLSGSLLIELLSVAVRFFLFWFFFWLFLLWIVFSFEMLNSGIQLFIFSLLHLEYSL